MWACGEAIVLKSLVWHVKRLCRNSESRCATLKRLKIAVESHQQAHAQRKAEELLPEHEVPCAQDSASEGSVMEEFDATREVVERTWPDLSRLEQATRAEQLAKGKPLTTIVLLLLYYYDYLL